MSEQPITFCVVHGDNPYVDMRRDPHYLLGEFGTWEEAVAFCCEHVRAMFAPIVEQAAAGSWGYRAISDAFYDVDGDRLPRIYNREDRPPGAPDYSSFEDSLMIFKRMIVQRRLSKFEPGERVHMIGSKRLIGVAESLPAPPPGL